MWSPLSARYHHIPILSMALCRLCRDWKWNVKHEGHDWSLQANTNQASLAAQPGLVHPD